MTEHRQLTAADGHTLDAYVSHPEGEPRGTVIVIQEIFGVNAHIRSVADSYAKEGYVAIAPALFDRIERGVEIPYEGEEAKRAYALMKQLDPKTALQDVAAAYVEAKKFHRGVGVVGFCYGGFLSWLSATRGEEYAFRPDCCVGYYAGGIGAVAKEEPFCPVMLHFGAEDTHIGMDQVDAVRTAHPEVPVFLYVGAGHAFNRDVGSSYNPEAAALARQRTLEFLSTHIA